MGKVVHWVLTVGKALVFLTFLVVISGFVYRFYLDKQVETLDDQLKENIQLVQQFSKTEPQIHQLQVKLDLVHSILEPEPDMMDILGSLEQNFPQKARIEQMTLKEKNTLVVEGVADNEIVFANLLGAFTQYEPYSQIVIDNLQSGGVENPEITFTIQISLKGPNGVDLADTL